MGGGPPGVWRGGAEPEARSEAGLARGCGSVVLPGRHRRSRAPARRTGKRAIADSRTGAAGWPSTGGPRFFSRSLAVMGREAPRERRAHLFTVIEEMTRERSQGEPDTTPARIAHLIEIARLSRASYYRWLEPKLGKRDDADLRDLIQRLALQRRYEGYRRLTTRLNDQGLVVNVKRVLRLTAILEVGTFSTFTGCL